MLQSRLMVRFVHQNIPCLIHVVMERVRRLHPRKLHMVIRLPRDMDDMLENFDMCMRQKFLELPECNFILKRARKLNTTADSASIIYQLVSDGAGIALMPEWCTTKNTKLIEVPNIDFDYEFILTGTGNPLTVKTPKVQAFLEFFYEFCGDYDIPLEMFE